MIKYVICFCAVLLISLILKAQKQIKKFQLIEDIYNRWKKLHIGKANTACDTFFYSDCIYPDVYDGIKDLIKEKKTIARRVHLTPLTWADTTNAEKITFTQDEINFIIKHLDKVKHTPWGERMFNNARLVKLRTIDKLLDSVDASKDSLLKKLCHKIHFFSTPIFLRNSTLCLFYFGERDILGEKGECWLYRKEKRIWKEFGRLRVWFK